MQQPSNQDNIPFEEQCLIDELVEFWRTHDEPRDLDTHLRGTLKPGHYSAAWFLFEVRDDLRTDKHSKYAASSTFEFRQFLEAKYRRVAKPYLERLARDRAFDEAQAETERQARVKAEAKEREENQRWLRDYSDDIRKEMAKTTDREKRIELGLKLNAITPYTGVSYVPERHCKNCSTGISSAINPRCPSCKGYICLNCLSCFCDLGNEMENVPHEYKNMCWQCHLVISSEKNDRCSVCGWYICSLCGSCSPVCNKKYIPVKDKAVDPFLPDYPDDLS
jgi:hypothetical protein